MDGSNPSPAFVIQTYEILRHDMDSKGELHLSIKEMAARLEGQGNEMMVGSALHILDREQYIDRFDVPGRRIRGTRLLKSDLRGPELKLDIAKLEEKARCDRAKLKSMVDLAYGRSCRQQAILRYSGRQTQSLAGIATFVLKRMNRRVRPPRSKR